MEIGPLRDQVVTWYKITYTGEQVAQWDFQNNVHAFVLEVPLRNLLTSICNFVPCDRVLQRTIAMRRTRLSPVSEVAARAHTLSSVWPIRPVRASLSHVGFILHLISVSFSHVLKILLWSFGSLVSSEVSNVSWRFLL